MANLESEIAVVEDGAAALSLLLPAEGSLGITPIVVLLDLMPVMAR